MLLGDLLMDKKTDLRILKTKRNLYDTLEKLLMEQPFEEIKVSDICSAALINRSTFYAHYNDKYELLQEYINTLKDNLITELNKNNNIKNSKEYYIEIIKLLLNYIDDRRETYFKIMINNKNSITMDIFYDAINKDIIRQIEEKNDHDKHIPSSIISQFYLGGVFNIFIEWIKFSNKYSKENIVNYLDLLIPDDLI